MKEDVINLTKQLVTIPSYLDEKTNEKLIGQFISDYLKNYCPWLTIKKQLVTENRFNLIASDGCDPRIMFVCHLDTVKPTRDKEIVLTPKVIDNKLYGLGAVDMKGGIAALLAALVENGPTKGVTVIFDCDEEYYFLGIKKILQKYSFKPKLVVCPEPTDLEIVNGCRGIIEIEFEVIGQTAHASTPQLGVNAIEQLLKLVKLLKKNFANKKNKFLGKTAVNLAAIKGGRLLDGKITTQANAVPDIAWFLLDVRPADTTLNAESIINYIEILAKSLSVRIRNKKINLNYSSYWTGPKELTIFEKTLIKSGQKIKYRKLDKEGFNEGALIVKEWNCPAISFGPSFSKTAHTKDEYVDINSLKKLTQIFKSLISKFS